MWGFPTRDVFGRVATEWSKHSGGRLSAARVKQIFDAWCHVPFCDRCPPLLRGNRSDYTAESLRRTMPANAAGRTLSGLAGVLLEHGGSWPRNVADDARGGKSDPSSAPELLRELIELGIPEYLRDLQLSEEPLPAHSIGVEREEDPRELTPTGCKRREQRPFVLVRKRVRKMD